MVQEDKKQQDQMAAEYVLGTLPIAQRLQVEQLFRDNAGMRLNVRLWEVRLGPLVDGIDPQKPPRRIWKAVHKRVQLDNKLRRPHWGWWRSWVAGFILSVVVIAAHLSPLQFDTSIFKTQAVGVVGERADLSYWLIRTDPENKWLDFKAVNVQPPPEDSVYEIWMMPPRESPVSLGLLPLNGEERKFISQDQAKVWSRSQKLNVTLEPEGGSPTGLPVGPVIFLGKIIH